MSSHTCRIWTDDAVVKFWICGRWFDFHWWGSRYTLLMRHVSSVSVCRASVVAGFPGHGNSILKSILEREIIMRNFVSIRRLHQGLSILLREKKMIITFFYLHSVRFNSFIPIYIYIYSTMSKSSRLTTTPLVFLYMHY